MKTCIDVSPLFRQVGKGFCGSVWAADRPGPASVMKREDGGPYRSLKKDSAAHMDVERSLSLCQTQLKLASTLNIPQHREFIPADKENWWRLRQSRFPPGFEHCNTLITERILPFDRTARARLVDIFCPEPLRETINASRKNEDCIARVYLGRRRKNVARPSKYFSLRNKPLHIDQLIALGLPIERYAREMADALAIIYWHAHKDANDVEFVIAPPRPGQETFPSDLLGPHRMWMLDFDCVNPITLDEDGIEQAACAFFRNDPYYPRPDGDDETDHVLWKAFSSRFILASGQILGDERLPRLLIQRLEELGVERQARVATIVADDMTGQTIDHQ